MPDRENHANLDFRSFRTPRTRACQKPAHAKEPRVEKSAHAEDACRKSAHPETRVSEISPLPGTACRKSALPVCPRLESLRTLKPACPTSPNLVGPRVANLYVRASGILICFPLRTPKKIRNYCCMGKYKAHADQGPDLMLVSR